MTVSADVPIAAVVFDYDGTLVDTRAADEAAVAELVARDPAAAAGVATFWALEGRPIVERLERAWPGRAAELLPCFDRRVVPRVLPGVAAVVAELRRRGLRLAVVSSRRCHPLRWGLAASGLGDLFDVVVGLEDVRSPKPDPEGLLLACRRLEVVPAAAVYVGDSEVDVEAGRRAGMTTYRAAWAGRHRGVESLAGGDGVPPSAATPVVGDSVVELADPAELLAHLDGRVGGAPLAATG